VKRGDLPFSVLLGRFGVLELMLTCLTVHPAVDGDASEWSLPYREALQNLPCRKAGGSYPRYAYGEGVLSSLLSDFPELLIEDRILIFLQYRSPS
jgi:hypothetical protein